MDTLTNELSLKAMTSIGNLISDYDRGLISKGQVATGCRAVFDAVGGLVSPSCLDLLSQAAKEYACKGYEVLLVNTEEGLQGTIRQCGGAKVIAVQSKSVWRAPTDAPESDLVARNMSEKYVGKLLK